MRKAFATIISASAAPYGYTLTIWSTGALLIHYRQAPTVAEIFMVIAGAIGAFAGLWLLGRPTVEQAGQLRSAEVRARAGSFDLFAVGLAAGAGALIAMVPGWSAWPLAAFGVTGTYLLAASCQLAVAKPHGGGNSADGR
jgi:hypothetical protein